MSDTLCDRIAAVHQAHRWGVFRCDDGYARTCCRCQWRETPDGPTHAEHVADAVIAALGEARTVTTPDQLASLPFLAVVRETYTSAAGWEHSLIWERRFGNESWACIAAPIPPTRTVPNLPAVVLWPTDWSNDD